MTTGQSEKWLIDLMIVNNMGQNETGTNTTFLAVQQVTKGGVFVGSNKLKHTTTGMMELRIDADTGSSFVIFTKNRRGIVNRRLFFSLAESGDVVYDTRRLNSDNEAREALSAEKKQMEEEERTFDTLFGDGMVERYTPRDDFQEAIEEDRALKKIANLLFYPGPLSYFSTINQNTKKRL